MNVNAAQATQATAQKRSDALASFMRTGKAYYRFRSTHRKHEIDDILLGSKMFFSGVDAHSQDDIYEGKPILRWDDATPSLEEVVALVRRNTRRQTDRHTKSQAQIIHDQMWHGDDRAILKAWIEIDTERMFAGSSICCSTKNPFVQRRWAEYANRGTGYSLVFDFSSGWKMQTFAGHKSIGMVPMPVNYLPDNRRPVVTLSLRSDDDRNAFDYIEKGLLTKPSTWGDQEEYRIIRMGLGPGEVEFPSASLVGILLGYHVSDEDRALIEHANAQRNVPLSMYVAVPSNDEDAHIRFQPTI